jgi:hypothetical protein
MVVRPAKHEDRVTYATANGYARLDWVTAADNHDARRF